MLTNPCTSPSFQMVLVYLSFVFVLYVCVCKGEKIEKKEMNLHSISEICKARMGKKLSRSNFIHPGPHLAMGLGLLHGSKLAVVNRILQLCFDDHDFKCNHKVNAWLFCLWHLTGCF